MHMTSRLRLAHAVRAPRTGTRPIPIDVDSFPASASLACYYHRSLRQLCTQPPRTAMCQMLVDAGFNERSIECDCARCDLSTEVSPSLGGPRPRTV